MKVKLIATQRLLVENLEVGDYFIFLGDESTTYPRVYRKVQRYEANTFDIVDLVGNISYTKQQFGSEKRPVMKVKPVGDYIAFTGV